MTTGILLLAAGGSQRLGRPKQLVPCPGTGEPLLARMARMTLASGIGPLLVVLGAEAPACQQALHGLLREHPGSEPPSLATLVHPLWAEGMGGTIAAGMAAFASRGLSDVLICLCDQPEVTADSLRRLQAAHRAAGTLITASAYAGILGVPALFSAPLFGRLQALRGARGAQALFRETSSITAHAMDEAACDLDTPAELSDWLARNA